MKQVRFIPTHSCGLQVREPQEGQQESRRIAGRPIVFGVRSNNLTPWSDYREVYEVLEPGCISAEVLQQSDIVLNTNHRNDVSCILGRYRNDSDKDTLHLELRADGVDCDCDLPNTQTASDTLELIKRGDIDGMSFAFEDDWEDSENGVSYERMRDEETGKKEIWVRHVKRITALYDVSVVTHPAYDQTTVGVREQSDRINEAIEAAIKREADKEATDEEKEEEKPADNAETQEEEKREEDGKQSDNSDDSDDSDDDKKEEEEAEKERERMAAQRHRRMMQRAHMLREQEIDNLFV